MDTASKFIYVTSANEKSYNSYLELAGVFWASAVYFITGVDLSAEYGTVKLYVGFGSLLAVFALAYYVYRRRETVKARNRRLFGLNIDMGIIMCDFFNKFVNFGSLSCILALFNSLEKPGNKWLNMVLSLGVLTVHFVLFFIVRHKYSLVAQRERTEANGEGVANGQNG